MQPTDEYAYKAISANLLGRAIGAALVATDIGDGIYEVPVELAAVLIDMLDVDMAVDPNPNEPIVAELQEFIIEYSGNNLRCVQTSKHCGDPAMWTKSASGIPEPLCEFHAEMNGRSFED